MKKFFYHFSPIIFISLLLLMSLPYKIMAEETGAPVLDYEDELTKGTVILEKGNLIGIILEGIRALLAFTGATALVMIIFAGQKWMMAGGNEENIKKAKDLLRNALIGLSITILAYAIATWGLASLRGGVLPPFLFFL